VNSQTAKAAKKGAPPRPPRDSAAQFEKLLKTASAVQHHSLRLYVTGTTARSTQAVANIRALCEEYLPGRYDLEVIDIYQQPTEAMDQQIIAAPTLVKTLPKPPKRLIGDLSDRDRVIVGLELGDRKTRKGTKWSVI
jgi:circadian clock protein KaiB